jgi:hypothetical protein
VFVYDGSVLIPQPLAILAEASAAARIRGAYWLSTLPPQTKELCFAMLIDA